MIELNLKRKPRPLPAFGLTSKEGRLNRAEPRVRKIATSRMPESRKTRSRTISKRHSNMKKHWARACTGTCASAAAKINRALQSSAKAVAGMPSDPRDMRARIAPTANTLTLLRKVIITTNTLSAKTPSFPKLPHHRQQLQTPNRTQMLGAEFEPRPPTLQTRHLDYQTTNQLHAISALLVNLVRLLNGGWW